MTWYSYFNTLSGSDPHENGKDSWEVHLIQALWCLLPVGVGAHGAPSLLVWPGSEPFLYPHSLCLEPRRTCREVIQLLDASSPCSRMLGHWSGKPWWQGREAREGSPLVVWGTHSSFWSSFPHSEWESASNSNSKYFNCTSTITRTLAKAFTCINSFPIYNKPMWKGYYIYSHFTEEETWDPKE